MPRGRPPQQPQLTGSQAQYVLNRLIADRRLSSADVRTSLSAMTREIADLESRLAGLRAAAGGGAAGSQRQAATSRAGARTAGAEGVAKGAKRGGKRRRRRASSAQATASQRIQGQYLGYIRQIPESGRAKYKAIAKKDGREAAIKAMRSQLGK
jgi:hypothetical protein